MRVAAAATATAVQLLVVGGRSSSLRRVFTCQKPAPRQLHGQCSSITEEEEEELQQLLLLLPTTVTVNAMESLYEEPLASRSLPISSIPPQLNLKRKEFACSNQIEFHRSYFSSSSSSSSFSSFCERNL
jgi:hypothetical protein